MISFLITFSIALLSFYGIAIATRTLFKFIKEGEFFKCFLMIAVVIIGIVMDMNSFKLLGYSFSFIFSKIVFIGLGLLLITIFIDSDKEIYLKLSLLIN